MLHFNLDTGNIILLQERDFPLAQKPAIFLIGPLLVATADRVVSPGPSRRQAILALLAASTNRSIPDDAMMRAIWGDAPPLSGRKILPPYVYRLRQLLPEPCTIERHLDGYQLCTTPNSVDVGLLRATMQQADRCHKAGDVDAALTHVESCLSLYRGRPLEGLPGPGLATIRHQIEETLHTVFEKRAELYLESGRSRDAITDLVGACASYPTRERYAQLLMCAYEVAGQAAAAVAVFNRVRVRLRDSLGIDPSEALVRHYQRLLCHGRSEEMGSASPERGDRQLRLEIGRLKVENAQLRAANEALGASGYDAPRSDAGQ